MRRFLKVVSLLCLTMSFSLQAHKYDTCAEEFHAKYKKHLAGAVATSPIGVPLILASEIGIGLIPVSWYSYIFDLKNYVLLLEGASDAVAGVNTGKAYKKTEKFWNSVKSYDVVGNH